MDVKDIITEIESGLTNSSRRRDHARFNLEFSKLEFERHPTKNRDGRFQSDATRRCSAIFRRVIDVLTMHMYRQAPTRRLPDPTVTEFLARVYKRQAMRARWKRADELTLIGGYAGFQFAGDEDPQSPVKINLWAAHELEVWTDPNDPREPFAVCTIDLADNQRRYRLYTEDKIYTWETSKGLQHEAQGGTLPKMVGRPKDNPYRTPRTDDDPEKGIIPFSFAHWWFPAEEFSTESPGDFLKLANECTNERLDRLGDSIPYNARPIGLAIGVDETWMPPRQIKPGDFIALPAQADVAGNGPVPTLSYLLPDLSYIEADWADLDKFINHTLDMLGVPEAMIRMVQSDAKSGLAIQAEQMPIVQWVEGRRGDWQDYEEDAARTCLIVAESHLREHGYAAEAANIQGTLQDWEFSLRWPSLYQQLPGPDKDRADDWRLQKGIADIVTILKEREGWTEEECFEYLEQLARRKARIEALGFQANGQPPPVDLGMLGGGAPPMKPGAMIGAGVGGNGMNLGRGAAPEADTSYTDYGPPQQP